MHVDLGQNKIGRDFIMGDLHGCYDLFMEALREIGFSSARDRLISVGDIIDRGPDSEKCLELLDLPWFYMVRGNHEQMMIDAVLAEKDRSWLTEYGSWSGKMPDAKRRDWARRFAGLPTSFTLDCGNFLAGICHAEPPSLDWTDVTNPETETRMLWGRKTLAHNPKVDVSGVDITVHGHSPLETPAWVGNRYFMDTGAWYTGTLMVLNIRDIWDEHQALSQLFKS